MHIPKLIIIGLFPFNTLNKDDIKNFFSDWQANIKKNQKTLNNAKKETDAILATVVVSSVLGSCLLVALFAYCIKKNCDMRN